MQLTAQRERAAGPGKVAALSNPANASRYPNGTSPAAFLEAKDAA